MMKNFIVKFNDKKPLVLISVFLILIYNVFVLINSLTGIAKPYTTRYFMLLTLIILFIHLILEVLNKIMNKEYLGLVIKSFLVILAGILIYKYQIDKPNYFKDNNLTLFGLEILIFLEFLALTFKINKNNMSENIIYYLGSISVFLVLIILMFLNINKYNIILLYTLSLWFNITLILKYFVSIYKVSKNKFYNLTYYIPLVLLVIYYIASIILLRTGNYNISYPKMIFQLIVYLFILATLSKILFRIKDYSIKEYFNLVVLIGLIVLLIISYRHQTTSLYNIDLILLSVLVFMFMKIEKSSDRLILVIIKVGIFLLPLLFYRDVNQLIFMILMLIGSLILLFENKLNDRSIK
jgi:hypothetical protein